MVSVMVNVAVVAFCELTENVALPFWVWMVTGEEEPLILVPESPLERVMMRESLTGATLLLQSRRSTVIVAEDPTDVVLGET